MKKIATLRTKKEDIELVDVSDEMRGLLAEAIVEVGKKEFEPMPCEKCGSMIKNFKNIGSFYHNEKGKWKYTCKKCLEKEIIETMKKLEENEKLNLFYGK